MWAEWFGTFDDDSLKGCSMENDPDPCFIFKKRCKDAHTLPDGTWIYDCDRCGSYKCADLDVISAMERCLKKIDQNLVAGSEAKTGLDTLRL